MSYSVKYVVLPSNIIFNLYGPQSFGPVGWTDSIIKQKEAAAEARVKLKNKESNFYNNLEKSILEEGFRNPILISVGWVVHNNIKKLPINMQEDHSKIICCDRLGGSRLWVAQKHKMDIPCIASDFVGSIEGELLTTEDDINGKFIDKPKIIIRNEHGVYLRI